MRPEVGVSPTTIYIYYKHRYIPYLHEEAGEGGGGGGHSDAIWHACLLRTRYF